jgi:hypothetical protein
MYGNGTQWNNTKTLHGAYTISGSLKTDDGISGSNLRISNNISVGNKVTARSFTGSFSGSLTTTGGVTANSITTPNFKIQNGYVILNQVSSSLNFLDDAAAAAGGVPLGGLYRNGNFILIRIT